MGIGKNDICLFLDTVDVRSWPGTSNTDTGEKSLGQQSGVEGTLGGQVCNSFLGSFPLQAHLSVLVTHAYTVRYVLAFLLQKASFMLDGLKYKISINLKLFRSQLSISLFVQIRRTPFPTKQKPQNNTKERNEGI